MTAVVLPPLRESRAKGYKTMKIRSDSPFAKLTEDEVDSLVAISYKLSLDEMVQVVAKAPTPIICSVSAMSRFLRKAKEDKMLREAEASKESVEAFSKRAGDRTVREATLAAMRDRMFEVAVDSNNSQQLMQVYGTLNEEKAKEKELELEERKIKVAEENAKLGWKKIENENLRSGVRLLPKSHELLSDPTRKVEEKVASALNCLRVEGGQLLLAPSNGAPQIEMQ
jgi:hypothetical protein